MKLWAVKQNYGVDTELILLSHIIKRGKAAEQGASELQDYRSVIVKPVNLIDQLWASRWLSEEESAEILFSWAQTCLSCAAASG